MIRNKFQNYNNNFNLPPNPNGKAIGNGAIASETSRSRDLSESGGLFRAGFSSSITCFMGDCTENVLI